MGKNVAWSLFKPIFNKMGFITLVNVEKERLYLQRMKWSMCVLRCFSHVQLFATPWTVARQAPLSVGFSRQEYWSGLPWPPTGDLPDSGIKPVSPASSALPGGSLTLMPPGKHTFTATSRLVRWTSLAVQWLRLRFQCWGWRFKPWSGNQDPTYCRVPPPPPKKTTKKPVFDWMTGDCWLAEMTHHRTTTGISHTKW